MTVVAGAHDLETRFERSRQIFAIEKLTLHPDYTGNSKRPIPPHLHDIAIIKLDAKVETNENVAIAPLSDKIEWNQRPGTEAVVIGWGFTERNGRPSNKLLQVSVELESVNICKEKYIYRKPVDSYICTKPADQDSCKVNIK